MKDEFVLNFEVLLKQPITIFGLIQKPSKAPFEKVILFSYNGYNMKIKK